MPDVSIAISVTDNYTTTLKKMETETATFQKTAAGLQEQLDKLNSTKAKLKVDADDAKDELKEATKAYKELRDEASRTALQMAQQKYTQASDNLKAVSRAADQTRKSIDNAQNSMSKMENRAGSTSGTLDKLAKAGLFNMVGQAGSAALSTFIGSAFGSEAGSFINSTLSGAATGAAIGSVVPGIGTAIGAAVGGISGLLTGATSVYTNRDNAFKSTIQDLYNTRTQEQAASLSSGSAGAAEREKSLVAFSTLLGGKDEAKSFLSGVVDMANKTPFFYDDLTSMAKTMLAYGYDTPTVMENMQRIGDTGAALGWSTQDMVAASTYLGRMNSTGKTSLEYLNPLLERGVDVWGALSEGLGKSTQEVQKMVTKGLLPGAEAAELIYKYLGKNYANSMEEQANTYAGLSSTLEGLQNEMDIAMGEGYNETRMKGLNAQIEYLNGEGGEGLKEANRLIGEWQASLENEKEETTRKYEQEALDRIKAEGLTGAEAGKELALARSNAEAEFMAGEGYQTYLKTQTSLVDGLRSSDVIRGSWENFGYTMSQAFNKGLGEGILGTIAAVTVRDPLTTNPLTGMPYTSAWEAKSNAWGLDRVPYDNYLTYLHEGERVLTAQQARAMDGGVSGVTVQITGTLSVREEADVEKIANAIYRKMQRRQEEAV